MFLGPKQFMNPVIFERSLPVERPVALEYLVCFNQDLRRQHAPEST